MTERRSGRDRRVASGPSPTAEAQDRVLAGQKEPGPTDAVGLTDDEFVAQYMRMVQYWAKRMVAEADRDDAMIDGMVAVWRARQSYQEGHGGSLSHWVRIHIQWAILDGSRTRHATRRVWRTEMLPLQDEYALMRDSHDADDPTQRFEAGETIMETRKALSDEDRALFDALISGQLAREYADSIGVTESRISQRVRVIRTVVERKREAHG